jgi:hypothetical protein
LETRRPGAKVFRLDSLKPMRPEIPVRFNPRAGVSRELTQAITQYKLRKTVFKFVGSRWTIASLVEYSESPTLKQVLAAVDH